MAKASGLNMIHMKKDLKYIKLAVRSGIIIIITVAVIGCLSMIYLNYLRGIVRKESQDYLTEISVKVSENIHNAIEKNTNVLETIAKGLENRELHDIGEIRGILQGEEKRWGFSDIALINDEGVWYHSDGTKEYLSLADTMPKVLIDRESVATEVKMVKGEESILFAVPVDGLVINGVKIPALAATYSLDTINKTLSLTTFNGAGFMHIVTSKGAVIVRSKHPGAVEFGYNFLSLFRNKSEYAQLSTDFSNGKSGFLDYNLQGVHKYMNYNPIGIQDWYLITIVPTEAVNVKSNFLFKVTVLICGGVAFAFGTVVALTLYREMKSRHRLERMAYVDPITEGNSKGKFEHDAERMIKENKRDYALLYTNISRFKLINDSFGRKNGDLILKAVYEVLKAELIEEETVGRLSADNFGVLMIYKDIDELEQRLRRVSNNMLEIVDTQGNSRGVEISFGVYFPKGDRNDIITMLDKANLAQKTSIMHTDIRVGIYDEKVKQQMQKEQLLEKKMRIALLEGRFVVYLQPKVELKNETIESAEALVRWLDPEEGLIYPDAFIPLFERNGFISSLDLYVFEVVCRTIRNWIKNDKEPVVVSVNLSRVNIGVSGFLNEYERLMDKYGIPGKYIEFEITESMAFDDLDLMRSVVESIHNMGCNCAMDDFGSGYSSLNVLKNVRVDVLKLDREFFINNEEDPGRSLEVVGGIISLAKRLGLLTVSEGVENVEQVEFLKKIGCDCVQGYYFGKPMSISDFELKKYGSVVGRKEVL